ncbi:hypothetical protein SynROS8604_01696 [Synechococcus sp. ROS8604]|nr:hypothetical protein SynROS8604_01696 [Synechococcus sp. ROS8604]
MQQRALSSCFPALPQTKMICCLKDGFCLGNDRQRRMQTPLVPRALKPVI